MTLCRVIIADLALFPINGWATVKPVREDVTYVMSSFIGKGLVTNSPSQTYSCKVLNVDTYVLNTVKPVCNDHLYDNIYYLWFIQ